MALELKGIKFKYQMPRNVPNVVRWDPESILRDKDFLLLWLSQILTLIGGGIFGLAVAFLVDSGEIQDTHMSTSGAAMGLVIVLNNVPSFFVAFIAGVLADWFDRKKIMVVANIARVLLFLVFLVFSGWEFALFAYVTIFFISCAKQLFIPAEASIIPDIVTRSNIITANSIFNLTNYITYVLGFILAGPLLSVFGPSMLITFLMIMFILASVATFFIRVPQRQEYKIVTLSMFVTMVKDFISSFKEGFSYIFAEKIQKLMLIDNIVAQSFVFVFIALVFKLGDFLIGLTPTNIGFASVVPIAVGVFIGMVLLNTKFKYHKRIRLDFYGYVTETVALGILATASMVRWNELVVLGISTDTLLVGMSAFATLIIGLGLPFMLIPTQTLIQERTKEGFLGRVYGVWFALSQGLASIPAVIFGYAADSSVGVPTTLVWMTIIIGAYSLFISRFRNLA